ncbi:MAG TPA: Clp protease N-terminal domain-containing protein [Gemmatimonadaceae bacterium]
MNGYNFTERVRKVLAMAREESANLRHEYVGTEHILLGLIDEGQGVGATVLQNLGVDLDDLKYQIETTVKRGHPGTRVGPDLPYTSRAKKVLELSMSQARDLDHRYVGTEHLLLGIIAERKGIAAQVLHHSGVTLDTAVAETMRILGTAADGPAARSGDVVFFEQRDLVGRRKRSGEQIEPPTPILAELIHAAKTIATEYFSSNATVVHAMIALLRRGEGFAIAILDRLGCDRNTALLSLEALARNEQPSAAPEESAELGEDLAEFRREMYQPWKMGLGTLDLLLFALGKAPAVSSIFAEQGIKAGRVLEESRRFSG